MKNLQQLQKQSQQRLIELAPSEEDERDASIESVEVRYRASNIPINDSIVLRLMYSPVKRSIVWLPGDLFPNCNSERVRIAVRGVDEKRLRSVSLPSVVSPRTGKPMTIGELSDSDSRRFDEIKIRPTWYSMAYLWDVRERDGIPYAKGGRPVVFIYGWMIRKQLLSLEQNKILGSPYFDPRKGREGYDVSVSSVKGPGDPFQSYQVSHLAGVSFQFGEEQEKQFMEVADEIHAEMHDVYTIDAVVDLIKSYSIPPTGEYGEDEEEEDTEDIIEEDLDDLFGDNPFENE